MNQPLPYEDESLTGYILRLSIANYYPSLKYIYDELSVFQNKRIFSYYLDTLMLDDCDLAKLSALAGSSLDILRNLMFCEVDKANQMYVYNKSVFSLTAICTLKAKLCPLCLKENEYIRKIWGLVNVTACPYHKVMMVDQCQNCSKKILWTQSNIFMCSCGHSHKNSKVEIAGEACISISEYVYQECGLLSKNLSLPIDLINLNTMNNVILFFAKHIGDFKNLSQLSGINSLIKDFAILQKQVFDLFKAWPQGFYESWINKERDNKIVNIKRLWAILESFILKFLKIERTPIVLLGRNLLTIS
ncbi:TniQ family protein [Paenibacillus sp. NPDC093718]|uniref:TniQ family protein n=1 Tax=Paenibacillus sp. NPDC093718 TaxID=3390601 RepID=UPI003D02C799